MASKAGGIEMKDLSRDDNNLGPSKRANASGGDYSNLKVKSPSGDDEETGLLPSKRGGGARVVPKSEGEVPATPKMKIPLDEKLRNERRANVAQYAAENFLNFVDFFQLYALLWTIMFQVPWPPEWISYTSWTLFANVDVFTFAFYLNYTESMTSRDPGTADPHFSLWGELRGWGLAYAGIWAVLCAILLGLVFCIHGTKQSYHTRKCWQTPWLERALQWFFYVFYLPIGIVLLRPFACNYSTYLGQVVMDHDTTQECWRFEASVEGFHGVACIFFGLVAAAVLLYVPTWTMVHLKRHIVFEGKERHEHFIQQKQAEYVLGVNQDFVRYNMGYFSSFRQPATAFRFLAFIRKLGLVLTYVFARNDLVAQLSIMWGIQVVWCIALTVLAPFRVKGSNVVMLVLDYAFCILGLLSLLRGGNTNSDAFVDSTFQIILIATMGTCLLLAVLVWTIDGACLRCNPVQYQVASPDKETRHWVDEILRVKQTMFNLNAKPLELIDIDELRGELKSMSECFHEAREAEHALRYTLQDCMEDVQATVDECEARAMFPNPQLAAVLPGLKAEIEHQSEVQALVAPRSRTWMRKLQAMRLFRIGYRGPQSDSDDDFADFEAQTTSQSIPELLAATKEALVPPVDSAVTGALKKQWRARIQQWKQQFYKSTGARPKRDDLWEIDDWRKNYLLLKDATGS